MHALRGLDLTVRDGETHCLLGTSGCGKTTALRLVNRLEEPDAGAVRVGGADVRAADVIALRRGIGYVVQSGGLFPHMDVARNVGIMCELEGQARPRVRARVHELLDLVGLPPAEFAARRPSELSGGQRQRVGVARALALDPPHLLLDEPFGALDPITRGQIQAEFRRLFAALRKTVLFVTHDLAEAFTLADRISIVREGAVVQTGTGDELTRTPADPFVTEFLAGRVPDPLPGREAP